MNKDSDKKPTNPPVEEVVSGEQAAFRIMKAVEAMADAMEVQAIIAEKRAVLDGVIKEEDRQYPDD